MNFVALQNKSISNDRLHLAKFGNLLHIFAVDINVMKLIEIDLINLFDYCC